MNTPGIRFANVEWNANLALANIILAADARNDCLLLHRMSRALSELEKLLPFLTRNYLDSRNNGEKHRLALRMRDAHTRLAQLSRSRRVENLWRIPMLKPLLNRLRKTTEELENVLEEMFVVVGPN